MKYIEIVATKQGLVTVHELTVGDVLAMCRLDETNPDTLIHITESMITCDFDMEKLDQDDIDLVQVALKKVNPQAQSPDKPVSESKAKAKQTSAFKTLVSNINALVAEGHSKILDYPLAMYAELLKIRQ